jgi:hypothetical protein
MRWDVPNSTHEVPVAPPPTGLGRCSRRSQQGSISLGDLGPGGHAGGTGASAKGVVKLQRYWYWCVAKCVQSEAGGTGASAKCVVKRQRDWYVCVREVSCEAGVTGAPAKWVSKLG